MDRLALEGGVLWSEIFLLVFVKAAKLILGNAICFLSWVADRVLVAEVDVLEAGFDDFHLSKKNQTRRIGVSGRMKFKVTITSSTFSVQSVTHSTSRLLNFLHSICISGP